MSQGAEGRLFLSELFGQRCVIKERFSKKYRVPALDEKLTKQRILQEVKSIDRVRRMGVLAPGIYLVDQVTRKIYMEYLGDEAMTVKAFLYELGTFDHPSKFLYLQLILIVLVQFLNNLWRRSLLHLQICTLETVFMEILLLLI